MSVVDDIKNQIDIVDIISYETDFLHPDSQLLTYLLSGLQFGQTIRIHFAPNAKIEILQFEFLRAGFDER